MSAAGSGAATGVVLGIAVVLLAQEFGLLSLSDLVPAIEYLLIVAIVLGVLFGLVGWVIDRRAVRKLPPKEWTPGPGAAPPETPPTQ